MNQLQEKAVTSTLEKEDATTKPQQAGRVGTRFDLDDQEHEKEDFQTRSAAKLEDYNDDDDEKIPAADAATPHLLTKVDHATVQYEAFPRDFFLTNHHPPKISSA